MTIGRDQSRLYVVVAATLALLLQSVFMSWAVAAEPMRDAFGNVLCITSVDDGGKPLPGHTQLPECCSMGCSFAAGALAVPPATVLAVAWRNFDAVVLPQYQDDILVQPPGHDPGAPRGPPILQL